MYDEYIYVDATWELIGNTYVDLTPYYTKEEVEIVIDNKILEERLIRENAEYVLQANINNLEKKVNSEITQIKQKNLNQDNSISTLETNLQNEITRATNKENELSSRCDGYDSHISNKNNPHNVTKTQIGLNNVENLPIDNTPTLNSENYVKSGGVFNALENKVDKIEGKGLSDENFTYEEKTKLSNLKNYDDTEIVNKVNKNTSAINILNSDSTVNGSVDNKIKNALLDVSGLQFNVVEELPTVGENGIIYFVLNNSVNEGKNYYDEYIWVNNEFELLGQTVTEIDLSNYHTKAEISALLSSKANRDNSAYRYVIANSCGTIIYARITLKKYTQMLTSCYSTKILFSAGLVDSNGAISNCIPLYYNGYGIQGWYSTVYTDKTRPFTLYLKILTCSDVEIISSNEITVERSTTDFLATDFPNVAYKTISNFTRQLKDDDFNSFATKTSVSDAEANAKDLANATGVLAVDKGGTGKTTAIDASNMFLNALTTGVSTPEDNDYYISQYVGGERNTFHRRPVSALWTYIKNKISSVLGLTSTSYSGKAKTAGTADTAKALSATYIKELSINGKIITYIEGDGTVGTLTTKDTTYSHATQSTPGLMSSTDKIKLDGIESGANKIIVDTALSSTSTNPVQNKIINTALSNKAASSHTHPQYSNAVYICSTGAEVEEKTLTIDGFSLVKGACITVHFENNATTQYVKLNVNGTGAKYIYSINYNGTLSLLKYRQGYWKGQGTLTYQIWQSYTTLTLYYNGSGWVIVGNPLLANYQKENSYCYRVYADGTVEQWSNYAVDRATYVQLPVPYTSDKTYNIQLTLTSTSASYGMWAGLGYRYKTKNDFYISGESGVPMEFRTIGY